MDSPIKPIPWYVPVAFLTLGAMSTAVGSWLGWTTWAFLTTSLRVEGTVTEVVQVRSNTDSPGNIQERSFAPVFKYETDGRTYRIQSKVSSSSPSYAVGDRVFVRYLPHRPEDGRIDSFWENWVGTLVFGGGGVIFTAVGLGTALARRHVIREDGIQSKYQASGQTRFRM